MNKSKTKISILLVFIMCLVIINANIKSDAIAFSDINEFVNSSSDATVFSEYDVPQDEYLDIASISLETAIDSTCEGPEADVEYEATGSITQVENDNGATTEQQSNDNSTLYYLGEAEEAGLSLGSNNINNDTLSSNSDVDYYVENWQELSGDLSIKVNKQASCVTVYKGDTPIRAMICSAGESTPEGTFYMQSQWDWLLLIKGQYGRYCSQISGDYLFHSVPYNSMDIYDLDTEMYNQLGTLCSHGCIRLTVEDAKWIYDNCTTGVEITIYNDDNPGPLGKPSIEQIPEDQTWDPTDLDVE